MLLFFIFRGLLVSEIGRGVDGEVFLFFYFFYFTNLLFIWMVIKIVIEIIYSILLNTWCYIIE